MKREFRVYTQCAAELREVDGVPTFYGRPVVYNSPSKPIYGQFVERMMPGCFDNHLRGNPDIIACIDHEPSKLLGRTSAGTLKLSNDSNGMSIAVQSPKTTYANDLALSLARGDIRGMSFVFETKTDRWYRENGNQMRDVTEATIHEVSFVVDPAYPETEAGVRSYGEKPDWLIVPLANGWTAGALRRLTMVELGEIG